MLCDREVLQRRGLRANRARRPGHSEKRLGPCRDGGAGYQERRGTCADATCSEAKAPQPWTVEEVRAFLESARTEHDPMYAAYVLILVLGLRKGEVLGLTWSDITSMPTRSRSRTSSNGLVASCSIARPRPRLLRPSCRFPIYA
jgi:integrase